MERRSVGGDNQIELHGSKAFNLGSRKTVERHCARNANPSRGGKHHVTGIGHMRGRTGGVGLDVIGADQGALCILGNEDLLVRREPVSEGFLLRCCGIDRISGTFPHHRFQYCPQSVVIMRAQGLSDDQVSHVALAYDS